jgi:menaquinone-dependent protoporphyrinogen IX oxidase
MQKTLIVYGTRKGTTTGTVNLIAEVLRDKYSHIVDVAGTSQIKQYIKRIHEYDNVIIGSSIVSGWWKSKALSFAKRDVFEGKSIAIFVTAGGTLNKVEKSGMTKKDAINEAIKNYIDKYIRKFKFVPISKIAFGGKVVKREKMKYNNWNKEDIINWTIELGDKLLQKENQ